MISRWLNYLLNKIIWFSSTTETVTHEASFSVSAKNAFEICKNYAEFIKVMLRDQQYPPNPWWKKGAPGEVGGQVSYFLDRDGSTNTIVEQVAELAEDDKTGTYTLAWEQLSSKPQLPLRGYGCTWVLKAAGPNAESPCCDLVWTRHFKQPLLFGVISLTGYMKGSFQRSAGPIMDEVFRQYYAAMFPPPNRRLPKPTDRVVVVGAGPSGLHMAHLLRREVGVKNITILERSGRHGGKTLTVPDSTQPGIVHELGTCYLHPAYFAVRSLIKELRQILGSRAGDFGAEVAPIHYSITRLGKGGDLSLEEWVIANLQVQPRWSPLALFRILFPKPDTVVELLAAKDTYNRLHEQYLGRYDYSMPPRPSAEVLAEIDMSFGQYLENHGLSALLPILAYGQTAQGYGSIENTPAFWAMCWITPQLLDGYFSMMPGALPKKAMFKHGWETLWDMIIKVNELAVRYNTSIIGIERPDDGPIVVTMTEGGDSVVMREEFDYLVVAAPLVNPDPAGKAVPLDLRPNESKLLGGENTSSSQFRSNLYKLKQPEPYLYAHLNLDADLVLGPGTGQGDVFASRDSYLALNPEYCTFEGHQKDPVRGELREQMSYQWVENDKHLPLEDLDKKFHEWAVERFGSRDNYECLQHPTWTYFQRFDRQGLALQAPWNVLELQGRNRTLFVHASNYFESVLDIVNYNNMLVDGLSGKLNELRHPMSDTKPLYYQTEYWDIVYNKLTKYFLVFLDIVLGTIWTVLYAITRPILAVTLVRWLRCRLQKAFKTENPGPWWQHTMSHFIKVSPSVICFLNGKEDPVVTASKETLRKEHPEIPIVDKAVRWSYHDYRTAIRVWMNVIQPNFLTFITPGMMSLLQRFRSAFPVMYNYFISWSFCVSFNPLTGYSVRIEDDQGGGCYVPKCQFLATAKEEYGDVVGSRICTHVCKIFTEQAMKMRGIDCTLEPRQEDGSCMIRGVPYQWPAYADHTMDCKLTIPGGAGSMLPVVSSRS
jgi:hypothetical protein